jgi:hypothetical protein
MNSSMQQVPEIRPLSEFRSCVDFGLIGFREDEFEAILRRFPPQGGAPLADTFQSHVLRYRRQGP